jgi:3-deoxy-D-manno-octulosonic-acid transferase
VTGNLKFDVAPNFSQIDEAVNLRKKLTAEMQIVCAASTRDGEEEIVISAWTSLMEAYPDLAKTARLIIVPRHPQRFDEVYQLLQSGTSLVARKSQLADEFSFADALNKNAIILGDSMGEMSFYYALSDLVVMGGSLLPLGGQNFIEACSLGCPAILGEHTFNFQQASQDVIDAHAAIRVANVDELSKAMALLLSDKQLREKMSANAIDFSGQHMGATGKIMDVVHQY